MTRGGRFTRDADGVGRVVHARTRGGLRAPEIERLSPSSAVAALRLPTFDIAELTLYKRITLVAEDARIVKVFYPVFPPDANAGEVLAWLRSR